MTKQLTQASHWLKLEVEVTPEDATLITVPSAHPANGKA
jgi:hypothetical protein